MPGEDPEATERHPERHGIVLNGVRLITLVSLLVAFIKTILQHTHRFQSTTNILDTLSAGTAVIGFLPSLYPPPGRPPRDRLTRWIFYDNVLDWQCLRRKDRRNQAATTSDIPIDVRSHNSSSSSPQQAQLSTSSERQSETNDPMHDDPAGLRERRPYVNNADDVDGRVAVQRRRDQQFQEAFEQQQRQALALRQAEDDLRDQRRDLERRLREEARRFSTQNNSVDKNPAAHLPNPSAVAIGNVTSHNMNSGSESEGWNSGSESKISSSETASERGAGNLRDHAEPSSTALGTPDSSSTHHTGLQGQPDWQVQARDQQHDAPLEEAIGDDFSEKERAMFGEASEVPMTRTST